MTGDNKHYDVEAILENDRVLDLRLTLDNGRTWHLWGRNGFKRELELAASVPDGSLPILVGSGLGIALAALLKRGPVVVLDREMGMLRETGLKEKFAGHPDVHWLDGSSEEILGQLAALRKSESLGPAYPVVMPLYLRLDPAYYRTLVEGIAAMGQFQRSMRYPRFQSEMPRVLILAQPYFLYKEIISALDSLGVVSQIVELPEAKRGSGDFVETLLNAVSAFKPDLALTVNHFGMDQEGKLAGLLQEIGLALASWFVDSPQLILHNFPCQSTALTSIFTYDAGNMPWLREVGFAQVHFLPLATDPQRFKLGLTGPAAWKAEVSFVGESMTRQVETMVREAPFSDAFRQALPALAHGFISSSEPTAARFLKREHPEFFAEYESLPSVQAQLACEKGLTFSAARCYRLDCVRELMSFSPLIAGDPQWTEVLGHEGWRAAGYLEYYRDLPRFYPASKVNFNCTSVQMKGAVNQRVFDVPACGGFLITDWREQMENLFDPDSEIVCYREPSEIADLVAAWLADPKGRKQVAKRARKRILDCHTYSHRLKELLDIMRQTYA